MTSDDPYAPSSATIVDPGDDVPTGPSGAARAGMSFLASYTSVLPMTLWSWGLGVREVDLLAPFVFAFAGSVVILPSWLILFLPIVLITDPDRPWIAPVPLGLVGGVVGGFWGLLFALGDQDLGGFVACAAAGALPGVVYGWWSRRFVGTGARRRRVGSGAPA
jgi:hypothetical protein